MVRRVVPDDIKIIAQFLAERESVKEEWPRFEKEAFKLRRQLKVRGGASSAQR